MSRGKADAAPVNGHNIPVTINVASQTSLPQSCSVASRLRKRQRPNSARAGTPPKRLKQEGEAPAESITEAQPGIQQINAPTSVRNGTMQQDSEGQYQQEQIPVSNGYHKISDLILLSPASTNSDGHRDTENDTATKVSQPVSPQPVPPQPVPPGVVAHAPKTNEPTIDLDISIPDVNSANALAEASGLRDQIMEATSTKPNGLDEAVCELAQSDTKFSRDPTTYLIKQTLPILDHLADKIFECITECTLGQLVELSDKIDSDHRKSWSSFELLFSQARKVCQMDRRDLNTADLRLDEKYYQRILRKVHVATAISAMISPLDYDLFDIDKQFLALFLPLRSHVTEWLDRVLEVFHNFKAQAYIALLQTGDISRQELADEFFPAHMKSHYKAWKSEDVEQELTESEAAFLEKCKVSREYFRAEESMDAMQTKYERTKFLLSVSDLVKNDIRMMFEPPSTIGVKFNHITSQHTARCAWDDDCYDEDQFDQDENLRQEDMAKRAAQAAHDALNGRSTSAENYNSPGSCTFADGLEMPYANYPPYANERIMQTVTSSGALPNTSTREQYEKARIAATARAAVKNRGLSNTQSQRRPWSTEEEDALLTGLDRVKGPHWSQILAMFGADGTVSEVLKDRNQVQLKDKARNLKLFFLKNKQNVPLYLEKVTGELKTRAPARAAKYEVKERLKESGSQDQAAMDAINVLAAGARGFTATKGPQVNDELVQSHTTKVLTTSPTIAVDIAPDKQDLENDPGRPEQLQAVLQQQRQPKTEAEIARVIRNALDEADDQRNQAG